MLWDALRRVKLNETRSGCTDSLGIRVIFGNGLQNRKPWCVTDVSLAAVEHAIDHCERQISRLSANSSKQCRLVVGKGLQSVNDRPKDARTIVVREARENVQQVRVGSGCVGVIESLSDQVVERQPFVVDRSESVDVSADFGNGPRHQTICVPQRKVFTTPLLVEANKRRNTKQFTRMKPRCQRGGVRGVANQNTPSKRTNVANQLTLQ